MEEITLNETQGNFGLIIRDREDHDRYVVMDFEDMEILVERWNMFKKEHLK